MVILLIWTFLRESISALRVIGVLIVVLGVILVARSRLLTSFRCLLTTSKNLCDDRNVVFKFKRITLFFQNLYYRLGKKGVLVLALTFVVLAGLVYLSWLYLDAKAEARRLIENPQTAVTAAFQETLGKIGKLMVLPEDESPTLATVTDVEKLKNQAFFAKAQNGDKVLIYTENRLAILYRPSENKIIAVGTVNLKTQGQ